MDRTRAQAYADRLYGLARKRGELVRRGSAALLAWVMASAGQSSASALGQRQTGVGRIDEICLAGAVRIPAIRKLSRPDQERQVGLWPLMWSRPPGTMRRRLWSFAWRLRGVTRFLLRNPLPTSKGPGSPHVGSCRIGTVKRAWIWRFMLTCCPHTGLLAGQRPQTAIREASGCHP